MFPHSAGVKEDQVCILGLVAKTVADIHQHALDALPVVDVLLAAIAVHKGKGRSVVGIAHKLCRNAVMFKVNVFQSKPSFSAGQMSGSRRRNFFPRHSEHNSL